MRSFEWVDAMSIGEAAMQLGATTPHAPIVAKAGGMDLLDLMKEGILTPARVVNLQSIAELGGVQYDDSQGLRLGALVTLADIAKHPQVRRHYSALADSAAHAATPQVRNAATIGGNLLQRPRSWYFRNELFHRVPLDSEHVRSGEHQYGAIFDNAKSPMVHASTPATALIAYDASVHLTGAQGKSRNLALKDFFLPPDMTRDRDTLIEHDEILTHVSIPTLLPGTRAGYHKQTERDSYDWPICDVAVVLRVKGRTIEAATIVLGWVAPTPRRAVESEKLLIGHEVSESLAAEAARAAVRGTTPLAKNAYKVPVLEAVVRRTILAAA